MASPHPAVCYLLVHLLGCCPIRHGAAQGQLKPGQQLGSILVLSGLNASKDRDQEPVTTELPVAADRCRGYYDVMGQFDPPFSCHTGIYNYCCGTCGYRYCCQFREARLDQDICSNYGTPNWANVGNPAPRPNGASFDHTRDKTNLIVYFICGVVAIMVLVGIFTKLGLEKSQRPQRELNVSRALTDVLKQQGQCNANHVERDGKVAIHVPPENMQLKGSRNNFDQAQMNNAGPSSPLIPQMVHPHSYPTLEQQVPGKELNKYASLKAVAEKANDDFFAKRQHFAELAAKGTLPLHPVQIPITHEEAAHSLDRYNPKLPGQKNKMTKMHTHPLAFETDYKTWDTNDTTIRRQAYANKRPCTVGTLAEPHSSQPQHYMPQQPYFVTNSKTEVTV